MRGAKPAFAQCFMAQCLNKQGDNFIIILPDKLWILDTAGAETGELISLSVSQAE
jgi:hypothetical protein